ncbi:Protein N-terminal glutamine amidohydrolase [Vigna angularis]|uniref:Protein N-terminal glutamine amidohydrolase n=1 Tax=Phaseolus angularis TaxID=3914 RepID=A0A8T0KTW8_PHAAN|nr:Protein N-terminal glutamine amidohydrolase [Vigna angularis]
MATSTMDVLHFQHTPFYCEENVYLLCKKLCSDGIAKADGSDLFVVFISNEKKQACFISSSCWCWIICHAFVVIALQIKQGNIPPLVWDLDSTLPFPSPLPLYFDVSIQTLRISSSITQILFRVVHAPLFLRSFASDRRHMKDSGGKWIEEPPSHEPIVAEDGTLHNLNEYINISVADAITDVTISSVKDVTNQTLCFVLNQSDRERCYTALLIS